MRDIRYEFLPGIVDDLHSAQQLVEGIHDMLGFQIIRYGNRLVRETVLDLTDRLGYALKGHNQDVREEKDDADNDNSHHDFQNQGFPAQDVQRRRNAVCRCTGQNHAAYDARLPFFPVYRLRNRNRHLDIAVRLVVAGRTFPAEALDHFLGNHRFPLAHGVGVFHNAEIAVDNQHTAVIQVGHLLQLGIDDIGGWILQVVVIDQVVCDNPVLGRDVRAAQIHRTFFVIIQNAQPHDVAGHDSDDQHQEENVGLQAAEDRNFISEPPE